ncbi:hypothetical protein NX85_23695, partial [Aeromonas salmonicida subsp. salmonicida]
EREELELETENGTLKVKGRKAAAGERQFLHQGIAERDLRARHHLTLASTHPVFPLNPSARLLDVYGMIFCGFPACKRFLR